MNRENIDKIAQNSEDRLFLAKIWDKINAGMRKNIPANTVFLSPREQELCRYLFGNAEGLLFFGGYPEAERKMLCYLPDYLEESALFDDPPLVCLCARFYDGDTPSHRDFLGALMGLGIARETVGDILVGTGYCTLLVTEEIAPFLLQNFTGAGRTKVKLSPCPLTDITIPEAEVQELRDTVASARLDSLISSGFRIGRSAAAQYITAGKASIDGLPCDKPDKAVAEGAKISVRGLGKIKIHSVSGPTKKGRIPVVIHRYL